MDRASLSSQVRNSASDTVESHAEVGDALATTSPPGGNQDYLYGSSSTIAFVRHVFRSINRPPNLLGYHTNPQQGFSRPMVTPARQQLLHGPQALSDLEFLPRRQTADLYVQQFWRIIHVVFPILHKPTFDSFYNSLWLPSSPNRQTAQADDPTLFATLNLVFALGAQFTTPAGSVERRAVAEHFYQRARMLVPIDAIDVMTIPTVQILLLTTVYFQNTNYATRCWNTAGLAIRAAQSLGLHLERTSERRSQLDREISRRLWHLCVTMDRSVNFQLKETL